MKKLITFLSGLLLLLIMFAALFLSGAIYDTGEKTTIEPHFFQPNEYFMQRPGAPVTPFDLGADRMRNMLIERFVTEYFYVIPDINDLITRSTTSSLLYRLSTDTVFNNWKTNVLPTLQQMAEDKKLRTVHIKNITKAPEQTDYWIVEYDLITWEKSNDLSIIPNVTTGQLYLRILYEEGLREYEDARHKKTILSVLESGADPAVAFKIIITGVSSYDETEQVTK